MSWTSSFGLSCGGDPSTTTYYNCLSSSSRLFAGCGPRPTVSTGTWRALACIIARFLVTRSGAREIRWTANWVCSALSG